MTSNISTSYRQSVLNLSKLRYDDLSMDPLEDHQEAPNRHFTTIIWDHQGQWVHRDLSGVGCPPFETVIVMVTWGRQQAA